MIVCEHMARIVELSLTDGRGFSSCWLPDRCLHCRPGRSQFPSPYLLNLGCLVGRRRIDRRCETQEVETGKFNIVLSTPSGKSKISKISVIQGGIYFCGLTVTSFWNIESGCKALALGKEAWQVAKS